MTIPQPPVAAAAEPELGLSHLEASLGLHPSDQAEISGLLLATQLEHDVDVAVDAKPPLALLNACPLTIGEQLTSPQQALAVLGLPWLSALRAIHILGHRVAKTAVSSEVDLHGVFHPLWRQTLTLSFASELVARVSRKTSPQAAWLAGLSLGLAGLNLAIRLKRTGDGGGRGQPVQIGWAGMESISRYFAFQNVLPITLGPNRGAHCVTAWNVAATAAKLLEVTVCDKWLIQTPRSLRHVSLSPVVTPLMRQRLAEVEQQSVAASNALWRCPLRAATSTELP